MDQFSLYEARQSMAIRISPLNYYYYRLAERECESNVFFAGLQVVATGVAKDLSLRGAQQKQQQ